MVKEIIFKISVLKLIDFFFLWLQHVGFVFCNVPCILEEYSLNVRSRWLIVLCSSFLIRGIWGGGLILTVQGVTEITLLICSFIPYICQFLLHAF